MKGGGVFLDIAEINVYNTLERNKNKKNTWWRIPTLDRWACVYPMKMIF